LGYKVKNPSQQSLFWGLEITPILS
jgi:hypothetical protein